MLDSIYIGITGVSSHQTRMNVISNNISNVNTTGYKGERANFSEVMSRTLSGGGPQRAQISATNPSQSGLGVGIGSIDTVQQQGTLQMTGIETDLAIDGEGYFVVSDGDQRLFTRVPVRASSSKPNHSTKRSARSHTACVSESTFIGSLNVKRWYCHSMLDVLSGVCLLDFYAD